MPSSRRQQKVEEILISSILLHTEQHYYYDRFQFLKLVDDLIKQYHRESLQISMCMDTLNH